MLSIVRRGVLAALPLAALLFSSTSAFAQADDEEMPPPQPAVQPVYAAPLSQTTQTTYVPQSVAMSGPEEIEDFDFERPTPAGYTVVKRARKGMLIGGGITFGVSYMYAVLFAAEGADSSAYDYEGDGQNKMAALWIPVVGPFIQMANEDSATGKVLLVGLGAAEVTGAIMLYYGLTTKKSVLVRNDFVGSLNITPNVGNGTTGALVSGRF